MLVLEFIDHQQVLDNDKTLFNSGNHWEDNVKPQDYDQVLSLVQTHYWVDKFHSQYQKISIPKSQLSWLKAASRIGCQTGKFPSSYQEELDDFTASKKFDDRYFVRSETVSLKTGCHGCIPYENLKQVLESAVTSKAGHTPIDEDTRELTFYLLPWIILDPFKEFRVFVKDRKIIACSQQHIYQANPHLESALPLGPRTRSLQDIETRETIVKRWCEVIFRHIEEVIIPKIDHISSYTIDIALLDNDAPYFIEINPYGKSYGAGSALFHWLKDSHVFDQAHSQIYVRLSV
ncbi:MAG: hypothetical protein ACYCQJ_12615 [Nitrososphaerales archaeon]